MTEDPFRARPKKATFVQKTIFFKIVHRARSDVVPNRRSA
jgi:hypothetical protein